MACLYCNQTTIGWAEGKKNQTKQTSSLNSSTLQGQSHLQVITIYFGSCLCTDGKEPLEFCFYGTNIKGTMASVDYFPQYCWETQRRR